MINTQSTPAYLNSLQPLVDEGRVMPLYAIGFIDANGEPVRDPAVSDMITAPELYEQIYGEMPYGYPMAQARALGAAFTASLIGGLIGALALGTIGGEPVAAEYRFAGDFLYLYDGLSLVIVALGLFALPEIIELLARGGAIAERSKGLGHGWVQGAKDTVTGPRPKR